MVYNSENKEYLERRLPQLETWLKTKVNVTNWREKLTRKNRIPQDILPILENMLGVLEEVKPNLYDLNFGLVVTTKKYENTYGHTSVLEGVETDHIRINQIQVVLHYPEVRMTNSKKQSVTIKDLYVRFSITISPPTPIDPHLLPYYSAEEIQMMRRTRYHFGSMVGCRGTISIPEYQASYAHSHLSKRDFGRYTIEMEVPYSNYCLGTGELNMVLPMLHNEYDEDNFRLLLYTIDNYVAWESIEGVPHIRFDQVIQKNYTYPPQTAAKTLSFFSEVKRVMQREEIRDQWDINWRYHPVKKYHVVEDETFENFLRVIVDVSRDFSLLDNSYMLYKDEQGNYFQETPVTEEIIEGMKAYVIFRGAKRTFKVEGEILRSGEELTRYVHPKFKEYAKSRLEFYINYTKAREAGIERLHSSSH
jgi:hypothetical protein